MKAKRIKPVNKKGRVFKKGDQCTQNPSSRKHRDSVKKNIITQRKVGGGGLTIQALKKHDEILDDEISLGGLTLGDGLSEATSKSKAFSIGGLTDCSNVTFHNVLNKWSSTDALDQEKCAIVAAVTEVIRSKGGSGTETEYFAALMTVLEASTDENSCTALTFLLSLVIKKVPTTVLQTKFSEACKCFISCLEQYNESGRASLMCALVQCLGTLLSAQERAVWSEPSTLNTYQMLLTFTIHSKPKVRKLAQSSVISIIKLNTLNHKKHPVGISTAKFAVQMLEERRLSESPSTAHHVLNLLKNCLQYLSADNLKEVCETILGLLALSDAILKKNTMDSLCAMFNANPADDNLTADLNMKLISVLYEFQPSVNDVDAASSWLSLMLSAHSNLALIADSSCFKLLPKFFGKAMKFLLSENRQVVHAVADVMKNVCETCLEPSMDLIEEDIKSDNSLFVKIFQHVESGLGFKYAPVWDVVLQLMHHLYLAFGKTHALVFKKNVASLIDLHNTPDFPFLPALEKTVGGAIKAMGPELILKERPLNLIRDDEVCQFPNAWLLPVMKDSIENSELQFFISHFLPLALQVRQKSLYHREANNDLEAKVFETLFTQIWALLPGFCSGPTDLKDSFPKIAKILGTALKDTENLRQVILLALRTLISRTNDTEELKCIGNFSKNYVPILFNLYTEGNSQSESLSLLILETIRVFLLITESDLISVFITSLLVKLENENKSAKSKLMDLAVCMAKYGKDDQLEKIYKLAVDNVNSDNKNVQKKSYRILEELFYSNSDSCKSLLEEKIEELKPIIISSLSTAAPSSKAPRLRCLSVIIKQLDSEHKDFLETVLPEVILCTKALNMKARNAAFDLIAEIGSAYVYLSKATKEECVEKYFKFVMAGLAGSPHMASATLLTFTKLVHEYRYCISAQLVSSLLEDAIALLKHNTGEVVKSCLFFVRAVVKILDADELSGYLELLLKNLFSRNATSKNTYRAQIRSILQKLEAKCSYKVILPLIPEEHRKFMVHIHKQTVRNKRQKDKFSTTDNTHRVEDSSQEDSWEDILAESDDEEDIGMDQKKGKKNLKQRNNKTGAKTWIVDGDETVDLLDPSSTKNVVATKPKQKRNKKTMDDDFTFSSDGRMVIGDESDDNGGDGGQETDDEPFDIGEKDMLGGFDKAPKQIKLGKRKQLENMPDDDDEELKYRPGGRGIHRPQEDAPPAKQKRFGEEYKAKKSGGDAKLKGKPDPYAYVPLNRQKLNKRKSAKLSGQFHGMVKAARKGANTGEKHRKNVSKTRDK